MVVPVFWQAATAAAVVPTQYPGGCVVIQGFRGSTFQVLPLQSAETVDSFQV
jgi:hypothetical protein